MLALAAHAQTDPIPPPPTSPAPIIEPARRRAAPPAAAGSRQAADEPDAQPSALTAELFYEVLVGELTARSGDPGAGYALMLDAARRTRDGKLFQRAVEIALQSRSGDAALAAARAWKEALPDSRDARRFELQILIALNRIGETVEPLRAEIAATPQVERPFLMAVIARNYCARHRQEARRLGGRAGAGRRTQEPDHRRRWPGPPSAACAWLPATPPARWTPRSRARQPIRPPKARPCWRSS